MNNEPMSNAELQEWILTDAETLPVGSSEMRAVGTLIRIVNESSEFFKAHPECGEKYSEYFENKSRGIKNG
tara:strand:- start:4058 stop:4270 length:213 start_codon:yes stop_codon:yes gene_type:complete